MELTAEQIKAAIAAKRISAVTLDTNVIKAANFGFEHGTLARMKQFMNSPVQFVMPDVVWGEVRRQMVALAVESRGRLENQVHSVAGVWNVSRERRDDAIRKLLGFESAEEMVARRMNAFQTATGMQSIAAGGLVDLNQVVADYFAARPPFGPTEAKKAEFPDAIAVRTLEGWARQNGTVVLAVSRDGDWKRFCASSEHLVAVDDLGDALSLFHQNADIATSLLSALVSRNEFNFDRQLEDAVSRVVDSLTFDVDIDTPYFYEGDITDVELTNVELLTLEPKKSAYFRAVDTEDGVLVVEGRAEATVRVTAGFKFWLDDDKGRIPLYTMSDSVDASVPVEFFLSVQGDLQTAPAVSDLEVQFGHHRRWLTFSTFGDIGEPEEEQDA